MENLFNPLEPPTESSEEFTQHYRYTELQILDITRLGEKVDGHESHTYMQIGHTVAESGPVNSGELYATANQLEFALHGYIELDYTKIHQSSTDDTEWGADILNNLDDLAHESPSKHAEFESPYDDAVYFPHDASQHFIRVSISSGALQGTVHIETIPYADILALVDPHYSADESAPHLDESQRRDLLMKTADVWARTHDCITEHLSDTADIIRLIIQPPHTPVDEITETLESTADVDESQPAVRQFYELGGLFEARRMLDDVVSMYANQEVTAHYNINLPSILLHGPPGTGKTALIEILASQLGAELREISSSEIIDRWVGSSAQNLERVFDAAAESSEAGERVVLFFDEFEGLARKSTSVTSSERTDLPNILAKQIDRMRHYGVIVAAATNVDLSDLEAKVVRSGRFISIPVPAPRNVDESADIWTAILGREGALTNPFDESPNNNLPLYADDVHAVRLAEYCPDFTGADVVAALELARLNTFRRAIRDGQMYQVDQQAIISAMAELRRNGSR